MFVPPVLSHCWLGVSSGIRPVKCHPTKHRRFLETFVGFGPTCFVHRLNTSREFMFDACEIYLWNVIAFCVDCVTWRVWRLACTTCGHGRQPTPYSSLLISLACCSTVARPRMKLAMRWQCRQKPCSCARCRTGKAASCAAVDYQHVSAVWHLSPVWHVSPVWDMSHLSHCFHFYVTLMKFFISHETCQLPKVRSVCQFQGLFICCVITFINR